ncbi:MAG: hypothetical protein N2321_00600 [Melioribacteraceae bacterium]|nr:hypothetical protein [Melioribacteraceae bacterium]
MSLIRFIIWSVIFYFVFKVIKIFSKAFQLQKIDENKKENIFYHEPKTKINEKDIIEADYEEIIPPKQNNE